MFIAVFSFSREELSEFSLFRENINNRQLNNKNSSNSFGERILILKKILSHEWVESVV